MSNQIVGLENLPNVYISNIILKNDLIYEVNLEMQDFKSPSYSWTSNQLLSPYLKVCMVHTSNSSMADALKKGNIIPTPADIYNSSLYFRKFKNI